jgi:uncharacterized protein YdaU (DUF1376 family)
MSSELHFFPFYHKDWLTSAFVQSLTDAGYRAYVQLLCTQAENGELPDNQPYLQRVSGLNDASWKTAWSEIESHFPLQSNGKRLNLKMAEIRTEALSKFEIRSSMGKNAANKRWHSQKESGAECGRHSARQCKSNTNTNTNTEIESNTESTSIESVTLGKKPSLNHAKYKSDYETLYSHYPKRDGNTAKAEGLEIYITLIKSSTASAEEILAGAIRYKEWATYSEKIGTQYVKQISSWLRKKGWEEDYEHTKEISWTAYKKQMGMD